MFLFTSNAIIYYSSISAGFFLIVIASYEALPLVAIFACFMGNIDCIAVLLGIFSFGSEVHSCSVECLQVTKRHLVLVKKKEWAKIMRSCPVLKINIASVNFIKKTHL